MKKIPFFLAGLISVSVLLLSGFNIPDLKPQQLIKVAVAPANLTIYWIDTEGGAATLIVTPVGESVLIDSGNPGERDAGRIYHVAHEIAGLKQIDHLVTTHWHIDHYGGAALLSTKMPIIEVIDKGIPDSLSEDKNFSGNIQPYRNMAVQQRSLIRPGNTIRLKALPKGFQKLTLQFVGADKQFVSLIKTPSKGNGCESVPDRAVDSTDNANSMVLVMDYGPFRFFDGGDLTWNVEKTLVCPRNLVGSVDVYQVNHHGLDASNNPVLIKALAPTVSIMGNGTRKGCGPETITTLRNTPSIKAQYQLHKNIRQDSLYNTDEEYIANLEEKCQANYIKLTITPDGKNYTVSIPANKHERSFTTKTIH
ncbi:MAG: MBL fold metallo-hydrolase [Flavisolibacter sp.]|nr:MBL fold metallo-hydrolase [Flavisolibacter sp.]MBD0350545.1 MBL fold metallo-hydrolase [Flavisolibacter sp.]